MLTKQGNLQNTAMESQNDFCIGQTQQSETQQSETQRSETQSDHLSWSLFFIMPHKAKIISLVSSAGKQTNLTQVLFKDKLYCFLLQSPLPKKLKHATAKELAIANILFISYLKFPVDPNLMKKHQSTVYQGN